VVTRSEIRAGESTGEQSNTKCKRLFNAVPHGIGTAVIDLEAAIGALGAGGLPSSSGERRILRLAVSIADQAPVSVGKAVTGIDNRSVGLLVNANRHASGQRQFP
jgi:hypothetical protein